MKFHKSIELILNNGKIGEKFEQFAKFYIKFCANEIEFEENFTPPLLEKPSYYQICNVVNMKNLNKKEGDKNAIFLHSIAHIEYSAVDIALDACYRFTNLPQKYYADWLEVAEDEIRHFNMIEKMLKDCGHKYGDFDVHDGLFIALENTQYSLLERMAVLPRFMEANGLDANYFMLEKIKNNSSKKELENILKIILQEEILHVKKGDYWFKFACDAENQPYSSFFDIILKYYPNSFKIKRVLNVDARLQAGFEPKELEKMQEIS